MGGEAFIPTQEAGSRAGSTAVATLPPGPKAPALIQGLRQTRDPLYFIGKLRRRYGDVFSAALPTFGRIVYVTTPETVKEVLTLPPSQVNTGEVMATLLEPTFGVTSVITLDGAPHMRQRKMLLPPFHGEKVKRYGDLMREITLQDMESWPVGETFTLRPHFQRITLAGILKAVYGVHDDERLARAEQLVERIQKHVGIISLIPALRRNLGPWSPWPRFLRAREALDEFIYEEIALRRRELDSGDGDADDILSLILQARDEDGKAMSDLELRDMLAMLMGAGHETTTTILAWAVERLLRTPRAMARLRESLAAGEDDYLEATIKETLRARPVVPNLLRKLTAPAEIGGYELPAGTLIMPAITALHYSEDLFPEPDEFRPERFLEGKADTYSWIPFGGGVRRCIGAPFAEYELRTVLRTVIEHADLSAPSQAPERPKFKNIGLTLDKDAEVILDRPLH